MASSRIPRRRRAKSGEPNSRQLEPGGRLVASFGEAPASRVSRRDGHYDVHDRPMLVACIGRSTTNSMGWILVAPSNRLRDFVVMPDVGANPAREITDGGEDAAR